MLDRVHGLHQSSGEDHSGVLSSVPVLRDISCVHQSAILCLKEEEISKNWVHEKRFVKLWWHYVPDFIKMWI